MIFADTGAFIAHHSRRDQNHEIASEIWKRLDQTPVITTNHVFEETLTLLGRRIGCAAAAGIADLILGSAAIDIIYTSDEDEHAALHFFRKFADQRVSFTDCISFAVTKRHRLRTAFTFDRHFLNAGFRVIGLA
jgi:predicted nucleic acid-binding protein